jgi:predicted ribosomally synthesized peptide with SipW-like signal peptide
MKKIFKSAFLVVAIAAVAGYATYSFFSDTETSSNNTFTAGAIDLKVGNTSYVSNKTTGALEASTAGTTWTIQDLVAQRFFNFTDLKPGDIGEDTISFQVNSNDAWVCAEIDLTSDDDISSTEPELKASGEAQDDPSNIWDGELAQNLTFAWWPDDGDNVLEADEANNIFFLAPKDLKTLMGDDKKMFLTLADTHVNFFKNGAPNTPLKGGDIYTLGKGWCLGTMTTTPVDQDSLSAHGPLYNPGSGPRGTGFACDGAADLNIAQTDGLTADLIFTAVQSRNNMNYHCKDDFHAPFLVQ